MQLLDSAMSNPSVNDPVQQTQFPILKGMKSFLAKLMILIALATKKSALCGALRATQQGFSNHVFFFIAEAISHSPQCYLETIAYEQSVN